MTLISQSCSDFVCAEAVLRAVLLTGPTGLYREGLLCYSGGPTKIEIIMIKQGDTAFLLVRKVGW